MTNRFASTGRRPGCIILLKLDRFRILFHQSLENGHEKENRGISETQLYARLRDKFISMPRSRRTTRKRIMEKRRREIEKLRKRIIDYV